MDKIKRDLINSIIINKANLDNISENKIINGTLLVEIERVMDAYSKILNRKLSLIEESLNGSLDGFEFDNTSDVIEKSLVIELINDLKTIIKKQ